MRILLTILVILFSRDSWTQIKMKNDILVTPDSAVAYINMPNQLYFWGLNKRKEYTLICEGDTVKQTQQNVFLYIPTKAGNYTLELYKKKKLIDQFNIRSEVLNRMTVHLGNIKDSIVNKYDLLNNLYFKTTYFPQLKKTSTSVIDFDIKIQKSNGVSFEFGYRDSIRGVYFSNLAYLDKLKWEYIDNGKDVTFLEKYIEDGIAMYQNERLFNFEEIANIASMKTGDILYIPTVTLQSPDGSIKFGVNLKFIIKNE